MQILHEKYKVPPGGWRYEVDGKEFRGTSLPYLVASVREYYFANDKTPPKDLDVVIQDQICKRIPDGETRCADWSKPSLAELLMRAARALARFATSGFTLVSPSQLLERREVCEKCSFWNGESSFGLGRCGSCGCTGLKLYAASETCPQKKWK